MNKISVIILTKNEEKNIERAIRSAQFCDEIIVVDDDSNDSTINKIQIINSKLQIKSKIKIFKHKTKNNFAEQRNWAMVKASKKWILFLDADEEISSELRDEIVRILENNNKKVYSIKRRDYFWEKELKYGETKKIREKGIIRLFMKGTGNWTGVVHEEYIPHKIHKVYRLKGFINHYSHQTLSEYISAINTYSTIRAEELFRSNVRSNMFQILFYPIGKFVLTYFYKQGFLDGPSGFTYSFLMSFYSFLVRTKLFQIQNKNSNSS